MGLKFELPATIGTILRGYRPPPRGQEGVFSWQPERPDTQNPLSLDTILKENNSGIIGLFGLDEPSASACQKQISSLSALPVVNLGSCPADDLVAVRGILRQIAKVCQLEETEAGLDRLRKWLQQSPPIHFLFDLTARSYSFQNRKTVCRKIKELARELEEKGGPRHGYIILLEHRYWFDPSENRGVPYLDTPAAWYRTERAYPDESHLLQSQYAVRTRAELIHDQQINRTAPSEPRCSVSELLPVPRAAVYRQLKEILGVPQGTESFLVGEPGTGKSHIIRGLSEGLRDPRRLVCTTGFCRNKGAQGSHEMLQHLCSALLWHLGWDWDGKIDEKNETEFLRKLFHAVSGSLCGSPVFFWLPDPEDKGEKLPYRRHAASQVVLAIDALDEAVEGGNDQELSSLFKTLNGTKPFPDHIHLLFTCRPGILEKLPGRPQADLDLGDKTNSTEEDLRTFVKQNADPWLSADLQNRILQAGKNNFLVVAHIMSFVLKAQQREGSEEAQRILSELETGSATQTIDWVFGKIYDMYWQQFERNQEKAFKEAFKIIWYSLTAGPGAVPEELLHDIAVRKKVDCDSVSKVLEALRADSLLLRDESNYSCRFYHDTFRTYVTVTLSKQTGYKQCLRSYHEIMATWCLGWPNHRAASDQAYALRYAPHHLIESENWEGLYDLLVGPPNGRNFVYLEAGIRAVQGCGYLINVFIQLIYSLAQSNLSEDSKYLFFLFSDSFIKESYKFEDDPNNCAFQILNILRHSEEVTVRDWAMNLEMNIKASGRKWLCSMNTVGRSDSKPALVSYKHYGGIIFLDILDDGTLMSCSTYGCSFWNLHTNKEERRLHKISPVAIEPAKKWIIGQNVVDKTIFTLDLATYKPTFLESCNRRISKFIVSPDSLRVAGISEENNHLLYIWNLTNRKIEYTLDDFEEDIYMVGFSQKGWIGATDYRSNLFVWDLRDKRLLMHDKTYSRKSVREINISSDGLWLIDGNMAACPIYDRNKQKKGYTYGTSYLAISPNSQWIVSGSRKSNDGTWDHSCKIWDITKEKEIGCLKGHTETITSLAISPDCKLIASASLDNTIRLWKSQDGVELKKTKLDTEIDSLQFSPNGSWLIAKTRMWTYDIFDIAHLERLGHVFADALHTFFVDPASAYFVIGEHSGLCKVYEFDDLVSSSHEQRGRYDCAINSVDISPDQNTVVSGGFDGNCCVWNANTAKKKKLIDRHNSAVEKVRFSIDGRWLVSVGRDKTYKLWDLETSQECACPKASIFLDEGSFSFSSDGNWGLFQISKNSFLVWDIKNKNSSRVNVGGTDSIYRSELSPLGDRVCSTTDSGISVWATRSGQVLSSGGPSNLRFTFSADGQKIFGVTNQYNKARNCLYVLNGCNAEPITMEEIDYCIYSKLKVLHESEHVLAGCSDGNCRVWSIHTGKEYQVLKVQHGPVPHVAIFPDGRKIVTCDVLNKLRVWDIISETCEMSYWLDYHVRDIGVAYHGKRIIVATDQGLHFLEVIS